MMLIVAELYSALGWSDVAPIALLMLSRHHIISTVDEQAPYCATSTLCVVNEKMLEYCAKKGIYPKAPARRYRKEGLRSIDGMAKQI
jgi:hypothetical protein